MPTPSSSSSADTITIRLERKLKEQFVSAARTENRPASEVLRGLMLAYVERHERRRFEAEAHRQSMLAAGSPDEKEVMLWLENVSDETGR